MPRLVDDELFGRQPDSRVLDPDLIEGGLRSKSFATVVDLLGYGEIEGFRTPTNTNEATTTTLNIGRDIFLDGTPLVNANGDPNFQNVEIFFKNGSENQRPLGSIDSFGPDRIENTTPVGVPVVKDTPVSRSITGSLDSSGNQLVKMIRVTLQIPALQNFESDGDITGTEVKISINVTENDGTVHNVVVEDSINGRATSPYIKDYEIDLENPNLQFPLTVTVIRNTDDSTDTRLQNSTNFLSITTIITESQAYAGFAYVALRFNAQEFQSYPKRMYRVKGTKIKVPHDTTIDLDNGRVIYPSDYTFNGTFKTDKEWCSDPAWILYDLLTTDKGFGGTDGVIDADTLDVFSFYSASAYNSELITDPITGTTEPRFSCNVILNQKNDAYTLINDLCSVMRAMPFYSVGSLTLSQDRPTNTTTNTSDAQYIFTNANVSEQGFTYTSVGQKTKFTEVEVSYFDNDTQTINFEYVSADEITALSGYTSKFGKVRKTLKSFACTSRGQANRLARWFLYTNLKEAELCSFRATLEAGVVVRPSMIIGIADSMRAGVRRGGRIKSVTNTTTIVVDDANNTDLTAENSATLSVIMPDGTTESRSISSISGTTITVSSAFSTTPNANSIYAIENSSVEFQTYRVLGLEETNHCEYNISAIVHDTNKYSQVEDTTVPANPRTITTLLDEKPSPSNASAVEQIVVLNNRAVSKIFVSWEPVQGVKEYLLEFQYENDNPERQRVARPSFELFESRLGSYVFKIKSYNTLGKLSSTTTTVNIQAVGKTAVPADVQNVRIEPLSDEFVRLRFDKSTDVDVVHGGNVVIRSSNLTSGSTFTNSVDVLPALPGNVSESIVPNIVNGTYHLKFRDDGQRLSSGDASVTMLQTVPNTLPKLTVLEDREDTDSPPFAGTKVDCFFSDDVNGLVLGSLVTLDDEADFDSIADFDFIGAVDITGGSYDFANTLDLGGKQPLRLRRHFVTQGFYPNDLVDRRTANIDTWTDFDQATAFDVNAKLLVATTDSDPDTSTAGTYAISGTTITITKSAHGYSAGSFVNVDFTSGTGVDGDYEIQSVTTNTFVLTSATSLTTSGNCNFSAEFSDFNPFVNGTYVARGFKFRCEMDSDDPAQSIEIDQLGYTAELESRTETSLGNAGASAGGFIASGTSTKSVTFTNSFFTGQSGTSIAANSVLPSIGITIENGQSGDFFTLSNISSTGFDIDVKNGSSHVNRNFKYAATGFGRGS
jgi:predicted phage tail protein